MKSQQYYDKEVGKDGPSICTAFNHITSWLKENCYVGERVGDPLYGYTSYWGKPKLYSQFSEIPTGMLTTATSYRSSVVMKNSNKEIIDLPFSEKATLYAEKLDAINKFYSKQTFSYFPVFQEEEPLYPQLTAILIIAHGIQEEDYIRHTIEELTIRRSHLIKEKPFL